MKIAVRAMKKHHCPACVTNKHWISGCEVAKRSMNPDLLKIYVNLEQEKKEALKKMPETDVAPVTPQVGGRAKPAVSASKAASVLGLASFFDNIGKGSAFEFGMYLKTSTSSDILVHLGLVILFVAAIMLAANIVWHHYGTTRRTTRRGETNDGSITIDGIKRVFCVDCLKYDRPVKSWVRIGSLCNHCFYARKDRKAERELQKKIAKKKEPRPVCVHCHNCHPELGCVPSVKTSETSQWLDHSSYVSCATCLQWVCLSCQVEHNRLCLLKKQHLICLGTCYECGRRPCGLTDCCYGTLGCNGYHVCPTCVLQSIER